MTVPSHGLLPRSHNLCLVPLIEAVRTRPASWSSNRSTASSSSHIGEKIMTIPSPNRTRWSREQIHAARLAPLAPLLQQRGLQLVPAGGRQFYFARLSWSHRQRQLLALAGAQVDHFFKARNSNSALWYSPIVVALVLIDF